MFRTLLSFVLATSLAGSFKAAACSVMPEPPSRKFESSHSVILAVPQGVSIKPKEAASPTYQGPLQQTALWQVLVAWKGKYKPGDTFTTRQKLEVRGGGSCGSPMLIRAQEVRLMYLFDREPYAHFYALPSMLAIEDLQYLSDKASRSGDGP